MKKYTTPKLNRGKEPENIPKGSTKAKEWAKNTWYVSYSFEGKQVKVKGGINRITDPKEKEKEANIFLQTVIAELEDGYNPFDPDLYLQKILKETITLKDAIVKFVEYHEEHYTKPKSISSYKSKLNALCDYLPDNIQLVDIKLQDLEDFVKTNINKEDGYSQNTVKFAKRTFSTFYNVMIRLRYIDVNMFLGFNPKIKSFKTVEDSHLPYSDEQLVTVMAWLDANDTYAALFCRTIYFTCVRPGEIRTLQVRDINLKNRTLKIRAENKKGTTVVKDDNINIPKSFVPFLEKLDFEKQKPLDYIFGDTKTFFSTTKAGENTPYNKLVKCLEALKLDNQGYDLYSFKHTSNIKRWRAGWLIDQIMEANRHTNVMQTLTYLKDINRETDIKDLDVPTI